MARATVQGSNDVGESLSAARRRDRHAARALLWRLSTLRRSKSCMAHSVKANGEVAVRVSVGADGKRRAGVAGFATCGSVWSCPTCSEKIAARRQDEVTTAVETWTGLGGRVALATFTVSHRQGQALSAVWSAVSAGQAAMTSGKAWVGNKQTYGIAGFVRVIEVTHGQNGWHVHVHMLLFLDAELDPERLHRLELGMLGRWRSGIGKHGFTASERHGADIRMMNGREVGYWSGGYFVKLADYSGGQVAGLEVTGARFKDGRNGGRTPFQILAQVVEPDSVAEAEAAIALWAEWERGSKGRRQMYWSKGFRDRLRLAPEFEHRSSRRGAAAPTVTSPSPTAAA